MEDFNDSEVYTDDVAFEFIGNEFLFNFLSENEQKKELIRLGIATQVHYVFIYKSVSQYPYLRRYTTKTYAKSDNVYPKEKLKISDEFIFENAVYRLNPKVVPFMYSEAEQHVKEFSSFDLERFKEKLDHLFTFADNNGEKTEILKDSKEKLRKEYLKLMKGAEELIISFENPKLYGYDNLRDNIICSLHDHYEDIDVFLISGVINGLYIPNLWMKAETIKKRMLLCSELISKFKVINDEGEIRRVDPLGTSLQALEIEELTKPNDSSFDTISTKPIIKPNNESISKLIFREDGEDIFNALVGMTIKEKNTAFFSYLYLFLRKKGKTLSPKYQNKKYIKFVINSKLIGSFSSIQKTDDDPKSEKNICFEIFEEDLKKYYSAKSE